MKPIGYKRRIKMLDIAYKHQSKLKELYTDFICTDKAFWYRNHYYTSYEVTVDNDDFHRFQKVSLDKKGNILGYFSADTDLTARKVLSIGAINFKGNINYTFSKDFYLFLKSLYNNPLLRLIEWSVIVGNPIESMYDKICKKYRGRIVGTNIKTDLLDDGKYYDKKYYQIFTNNGGCR